MSAKTAEHIPVVAGFHPDPTVCRVGEDYYLAHSSFEYVPSVPLWHSRDLITWTQVGNALDRDDQFPSARAGESGGVYAPTLRHHDGRFWLITSDVGDGHGGQRLFHAASVTGPWSAAIEIPELKGIDPDLHWTDDGECLVSYCSWQSGPSAIWQAAIDPLTGAVLDEPRVVWEGSGLGHTEGPHLYRRGDWWYLVVAEGGTERGHSVSVARSRHPHGPFEPAPHNPVYTHRSTEHSVQNVGHSDLVERADGTWAAVHLGVRPRGFTPGFHVNGRETFLAEIDWHDDWPVFRPSAAVPPPASGFTERFDVDVLHPRWVSPDARIESFTQRVAEGLSISAARRSGVYARIGPQHWTARFDLAAAGEDTSVLAEVRIDERHRVGVRLAEGHAVGVWIIGGVEVELGRAAAASAIEIAAVPSLTHGPDDLVLSVAGERLGVLDGRYLSTEVAGGFTGRVIGVRVERGEAIVRGIELEPIAR